MFAAFLFFFASSAPAATSSWSIEPSNWDFGTVLPGSGPTAPEGFTLANTGEVELHPFVVAVGGDTGARFELVGNDCGPLPPGAGCTIEVSFEAEEAGSHVSELSVSELHGTVPPAVATLRGIGAGPAAVLTPSALIFGAREENSAPSQPETVSIANEGQLAMTISSLSIEEHQIVDVPGASQEEFRIVGGSCAAGVVLPPGASCGVEIAFSPTAPGTPTADLIVADDAPHSPQRVALNGTAFEPPHRLQEAVRPQIIQAPRSRSISWHYAGTEGKRTILLIFSVGACSRNSMPTIRLRIRELPGRAVITILAEYPPSREGCQKLLALRHVRVKLHRPVFRLALYDGALSPPRLRHR